MTADEIKRLREIAGKATPGEWPEATWYGSMGGGFAAIGPHHLTPDGESDEPGGIAETRALADARHIAAFNPSTALALLDRLEAAEKAVDECLLRDSFNAKQREKAIARIAALEAEVVALREVKEKASAWRTHIVDHDCGFDPCVLQYCATSTALADALAALEARKEE